MARRKITIDEKIAKVQEEMYKAKARYEAKQDELKALLKEKSDGDLKEIMAAVRKSTREKEEILRFLAGEDEEEN